MHYVCMLFPFGGGVSACTQESPADAQRRLISQWIFHGTLPTCKIPALAVGINLQTLAGPADALAGANGPSVKGVCDPLATRW